MMALGPQRLRWAVPLLLGVALGVRLLFIAATPAYLPQHDDRDYDRLACWVAEHGAPPDRSPPRPGPQSCAAHGRSGVLTAYRPPLWPLTLGATYAAADAAGVPRWTAGRVVQAVIGTVIVALAGAIAAELWGATVALVALGLGAVFLPLVLDGATLISEPLFVALELGAVLAVLRFGRSGGRRPAWALLAGVGAGLAALTRSTGAVLAVALLAGLWFSTTARRRRRLLAVAAFAVAAVLVVTPWTVRNARVLGAFVPVSTEIGPTLLGTYDAAARDAPGCTGCWVLLSRTPSEEPLARRLLRLTELQRDRESRSLAVAFARSHPGYPLQVLWHNSVRLLELGGAWRTRFAASTIDVSPGAAVVGAWELWLSLLAAVAAVVLGALRRVPGWLLALPAVLWVTTALVQSETPRFRAPIDPFVILLAAAGVAAVGSRTQAAREAGGRSSTTSASIDATPRERATDTR